MFKLIQKRPEGSDCTAPYEVQLNGKYTVESFVNDVLLVKNEWGNIGIDDGRSVFGDPVIQYADGYLKDEHFPESVRNLKVCSARASGGWSRMDYILTVEPVAGDFVQVTDRYGFRRENVFGPMRYVVYRTRDADDGIFIFPIATFKEHYSAVNECKYLERMILKGENQ